MKTIKKIVALATGATMLGATVMGAMAQDLADYPAPFVEGCTFDGAIVVGETAAAEDVVGAVDIASSLAVSGTTTTTTGTSSQVTVEGEAHKIEKSSNVLNVGETLTTVQAVALDEDELPTILAEGTFTADDGDDFDYDQELTLNNQLTYNHFADSDYNSKEPTLGVRIPKNQLVVTYKLDFAKAAESDVDSASDLEDLEGASIELLGNVYDIVEADNATDIQLELMGGATKDIMEQGETKTFTIGDKEYEVEVPYIGGSPEKVKFKVNGELTKALSEDDTHKLKDGTQIGVREILEEEAGEVTADQVEFYIGAEKLTIKSNDEIQLNDEDVDNVKAYISASFPTDAAKINYIEINWTADDDLFVTEEESVTMPGLESFKLSYEGLTTAAEEVLEIEDGGDDVMQLTAMFEDGEYTIDYLAVNKTGVSSWGKIGGDGDNERLPTANYTTNKDCINYTLVDGNQAQYFVATYLSGTGAESYLLEVKEADEDGVDIENVITGQVIEENNQNATFTVGSVTLSIDGYVEDQFVSVCDNDDDTTYFDRIVTKEGLTVRLPINTTGTGSSPYINLTRNINSSLGTYVVWMKEEDKDGNKAAGKDVNVTIGFTSNSEVKVSSLAESVLAGGQDFEIGDSDEYVGYVNSSLATRTLLDQGPDQDTFSLTYYGDEAYGNVYVAETEAGFGTTEGVSGTAVCKVSVPPAKLDSEVASASAQNLIVVGGPCANSVAADVMGVAGTVPACLEGFEEGSAMIKMYETGAGNTAMLVAGYSAMDTRRATRVVANYDDYALSGDEVEVTGTSLTDISVSAATAETTE